MTRNVLAGFMLLALTGFAVAAPPDLSGLSRKTQHELLHALVRANVAGANCSGYESSDAEWRFITDAANQLAEHLGLSTDAYDATYYKPAFDALDADPDFCAREGEAIAPTLERVLAIGGSIDKYKMQG